VISLNDAFLGSAESLIPSDAVAALLVLPDGRYIMQLRDTKPHIFYPGHWGLFGGAVDEGETEVEALKRELAEELEFEAIELDRFVCLDFDLSAIGAGRVFRAVYVVPVSEREFGAFKLREGRAFEALTPSDILLKLRVTPYDAFAIWLHYARKRFARAIPDVCGAGRGTEC
jgi:8-oxo-dGTP pyrophosphatase MutT (NUDIX family)